MVHNLMKALLSKYHHRNSNRKAKTMAIQLPETTEAQVDAFEEALVPAIVELGLEAGAQMPAHLIAHILRGSYDSLCKDKPNWDEVLNGT